MTSYYQCVSCTKTSEQEHCKVTINGNLICPHCLDAVEFAFSVCTADQPEPSIGFCDGCDELEAKLHLMDGDWLCDTCKSAVIAGQEDIAKAQTMELIHAKPSTQGYWCRATNEQIEPQDVEPYGHPKHGWIDVCPCHHLELTREKPVPREPDAKLLREGLQDLKTSRTDHWGAIKARVFVTLFLVWVCFAVWGRYAIEY